MRRPAPLGTPSVLRGPDGKRLVLRSFGGPPRAPRILILHGFWRSGLSPRMRQLAGHLSDRFRTYALDQRGHGGSEGFFRFGAKEVADLGCVLDTLHSEDPTELGLIGFSMGGNFLVSAIGGEPERFPLVRSAATVSAPVDPAKLSVPWWDLSILRGIQIREVWRVPRFLPPHVLSGRPNPLAALGGFQSLPLMVVHSKGDWLVPESDARAYFEHTPGPKRFELIDNRFRCHADALFRYEAERTLAAIDTWFEETLPSAAVEPEGR